MNFSKIDPIIEKWSLHSGIPLSTNYQGVEVRSFELVGSVGRAQIWVEVDDCITVQVWNYRRDKRKILATESSLLSVLDEALCIAKSWCNAPTTQPNDE